MITLGPVEIHIFKGRHAIDGSPLIIHAFDPSAVELLNFPKRIFINTVSSFLLDVAHAGKGSLKVNIKGKSPFDFLDLHFCQSFTDPTNRSLSINLEKHLNDQIAIQFKPLVSGKFDRSTLPALLFLIISRHSYHIHSIQSNAYS